MTSLFTSHKNVNQNLWKPQTDKQLLDAVVQSGSNWDLIKNEFNNKTPK